MSNLFFNCTKNTRSIIENNLKYIRSDVPTQLTEDERLFMLANGIKTVIDLRTDAERAKKECPIINDSRFSYNIFPISGGDTIPKTPDDVPKSYINMVDESFMELIDFILSIKGGVLYFCNAGKDRTGVVSAVLLHKLGKEKDYIVQDYMKSRDNLLNMLTDFSRCHPEINLDVITPHEKYIEEFLAWYTCKAQKGTG